MRRLAVALVGLAALAGGCAAAGTVAREAGSGPAAAPPSSAPTGPAVSGAVRGFRSARGAPVVPPPVGVRIPAIGVDSPLERLGLNADNTVAVPRRWGIAGWFAGGPRPGEPGPALILGHVDSRAGPAVFHRLRGLRSGDEIIVRLRSGPSARFVVQRLEHHDKDRFPTKAVYFPTLEPTLRLVTCGGPFDASVGHYRDNVIVFAALAR